MMDEQNLSAGSSEVYQITTPSEFSDITLVVEGKKLHTSRAILASVSLVWRAMFTWNFKEKNDLRFLYLINHMMLYARCCYV